MAPREILPAGRTVKLFNDEVYSQLRHELDIADSFVNEVIGKNPKRLILVSNHWVQKAQNNLDLLVVLGGGLGSFWGNFLQFSVIFCYFTLFT